MISNVPRHDDPPSAPLRDLPRPRRGAAQRLAEVVIPSGHAHVEVPLRLHDYLLDGGPPDLALGLHRHHVNVHQAALVGWLVNWMDGDTDGWMHGWMYGTGDRHKVGKGGRLDEER